MKTAAGVVALLVTLVSAGCSGERFVDEIVLANPTAYNASVEVTGGARDGALKLATVAARSEVTVREVIDQGAMWSFRFTYAGHEEEMQISRSELERSGWRVVVPESFATGLRESGVVPPP